LAWGEQEQKGCGLILKSSLCRLSLGTVEYHIWKHRNDLKHGNSILSEQRILQRIKWEVCTSILAKGRFKSIEENLVLCHNWNLPLKILGIEKF
jgi:hypothetical protein